MYPRWLYPVVLLIFVAHVANYLYFFVDDEAIVLVYAQNLLAGRGLVYSPSEGRLEGYTNFLHVLVATGWLAAVKLAGVSKLWVFAVGTIWSLLAGAATLLLAARLMPRLGVTTVGATAGLGFLALAGPLAVWASTPLEMVTVALLFLALMTLLAAPADRFRDRLIVVTSVLLILYRLDGFVLVGAAIVSAFIFGGAERRRALLRSVVPLTLLIGAGYWAWRVWYFGDLLPMPFHAKVAFKLLPSGAEVTKLPETAYLSSFAALYWYLPLAALVTGWILLARDRRLWMILTTLAMCAAYVHVVGDWMFGFRFVVPQLPLAAVLGAATVSQLSSRSRAAGTAACALTLLVSAGAAVSLAGATNLDYARSWYSGPSLSAAPYFGRYYPVAEALRPHVQPGDRIAYNQAGFVTFLLELDNLDTLGLCSRFYAKLPARDVVFTEVGRYAPLTNKPVVHAREMYLLRARPRYILETAQLLRAANGSVPPEVLGGRYRLAFVDPSGEAAAYQPARPPGGAVEDVSRYYENLAHVANLRGAWVEGTRLPQARYQQRLPYLMERRLTREVREPYAAVLTLPERSVVSEIYLDRAQTSVVGRVEIALFDRGRQVYTHQTDTEATVPQQWYLVLPEPIKVDRVVVTVSVATPGVMRLADLRVLGQTPELRKFVAGELANRPSP